MVPERVPDSGARLPQRPALRRPPHAPPGFCAEWHGTPGQLGEFAPQTTLTANDSPAETMRLDDGANVEELVNGLHAIGTTARDVVAILQAIKAEGGIQADLEVQ